MFQWLYVLLIAHLSLCLQVKEADKALKVYLLVSGEHNDITLKVKASLQTAEVSLFLNFEDDSVLPAALGRICLVSQSI